MVDSKAPPDGKYLDSKDGGSSNSSQSPPAEMLEPAMALDWDGPKDPDNPKNWPTWKRVLHSAIPSIYAFGLWVSPLLHFSSPLPPYLPNLTTSA